MADEQPFVIEMILFFKRCAVPIVLVVIFLLLPCPEKEGIKEEIQKIQLLLLIQHAQNHNCPKSASSEY